MKLLTKNKIFIVGGNGFVGNYLASRFVQHGAQVSVLSRSGPKYKYQENSNINWIKGSIMEAQQFKKQINQADTLIHSLGALFDTSITKRKDPGQSGTYEQMNRDTLVQLLRVVESKKRIFYMSAVGKPPFIKRYQTTKKEAENILKSSIHQAHIMKPGFIVNAQHRQWSIPLKYTIQLWRNYLYPPLYGTLQRYAKDSILQRLLLEFQQAEPTDLQLIGDAYISIISNGKGPQIVDNDEMRILRHSYLKKLRGQ